MTALSTWCGDSRISDWLRVETSNIRVNAKTCEDIFRLLLASHSVVRDGSRISWHRPANAADDAFCSMPATACGVSMFIRCDPRRKSQKPHEPCQLFIECLFLWCFCEGHIGHFHVQVQGGDSEESIRGALSHGTLAQWMGCGRSEQRRGSHSSRRENGLQRSWPRTQIKRTLFSPGLA